MEDCSRVGRAASLRLTALLLCVTKFLGPAAVLVVLGPPGRRGWSGIILTFGSVGKITSGEVGVVLAGLSRREVSRSRLTSRSGADLSLRAGEAVLIDWSGSLSGS